MFCHCGKNSRGTLPIGARPPLCYTLMAPRQCICLYHIPRMSASAPHLLSLPHDMPRILSYAYAPTWYQHIARLALISMEVLNTVIRMSDSVALGHSCLVRSPIVILARSLQYLPLVPLLLQAILRLSLQDRLCSAHPLQLFCIPGPC